jgi:hypothetical protein
MWTALDIFIGLALCYALISLFCTAIQEFLAQMFNARGKLLVEALKTVKLDGMISLMQPDLVSNPGGVLRAMIPNGWGKPGIETGATRALDAGRTAAISQAQETSGTKSLATSGNEATADAKKALKWRVPFDIPADIFSRTLLAKTGLLISGQLATNFKTEVEKLDLPDSLETRLLTLATSKHASVDDAIKEVSEWYGSFMAQVEHWMTRRAQSISIIIGLAVAFTLNIDTVEIAKSLKNDASNRAAIVVMAEKISSDGGIKGKSFNQTEKKFEKCRNNVFERLSPFPIGWKFDGSSFWLIAKGLVDELAAPDKIIGLLMSAIALSLGSRFWFDTLKSLLSIRTGGQPKELDQKGTAHFSP